MTAMFSTAAKMGRAMNIPTGVGLNLYTAIDPAPECC